ncbi:MAG: hypothetical protein Q4D02_04205 [Clostridia bacterium]|nr:hypothetical protein [Clostridia bacterium]
MFKKMVKDVKSVRRLIEVKKAAGFTVGNKKMINGGHTLLINLKAPDGHCDEQVLRHGFNPLLAMFV